MSLIKFFEKCCNISTCLSIQISGKILKKTVSLTSEAQIKNKCMVQETVRSVLWSYPYCCNTLACLSIQITGRITAQWSFPLRISSVNVAKSAVSCGFGHIYWRNPQWKTSFFVQWILKKTVKLISEAQIKNKCMVHEAVRSVLWSYPFCCNISSIQVTGRILKKTTWLISDTQIRNEFIEQKLMRSCNISTIMTIKCSA